MLDIMSKSYDEEKDGAKASIDLIDLNIVKTFQYEKGERLMVRKMDMRVMPIVFLMYFLASFDRANVGQTLTMNLENHHDLPEVLKLTTSDVSLGIALFYVGYFFFEIPSNLLITKIRPNLWLARIMISWGLVTALTSAVKNRSGFFTVRIILGIAEAGLFPGVNYFLTKWYRKSEHGKRMAIFGSAGAVAAMFSGFITAGLNYMDGVLGLYGWQWSFIFYGSITTFLGIIVYFCLPSDPQDAGWLTTEEKAMAMKRLQDEGAMDVEFQWSDVIAQFLDFKVWVFWVMYMAPTMAITALQYYLPVVIKAIGALVGRLSSVQIALLTVPPFTMFVVGAYSGSFAADRMHIKGIVYVSHAVVAIVGYFTLTFASGGWGKYAGACIIGFGLGPMCFVAISWVANSKEGDVPIATASAIVSSFAQIGDIFATYVLYNAWYADALHGFRGSNMVATGLLAAGVISVIIIEVMFKTLNNQIRLEGQTLKGRRILYMT